ncbi:PepSY-associated TM helix domain-containing protein [Geminicoccus roseus]|uniref:PepSY-associated TM helix domain-containing protein n=1 Tax=Geminicoccus roseus TaxID=404900 RepID=UPI0005578A64|nr:PepSY-associated TM helix domain-containing protein [Geminicoccus roseus]
MMNGARRFWLNVHLWTGLVAGLFMVILGISGSALIWHDGLDELLNPQRAASTAAPALPAASYLDSAAAALGEDARLSSLRMPEAAGEAVRVTGMVPVAEGRPRFLTAWLEPADARVLDSGDSRQSLVGVLHVLHGSLLIPQWSGRQIVGWLGVVMAISAATGIWLWWPRVGSLLKALWWRRGRKPTANLHNVLGAWIAVPLFVVSVTGVYISFPQAARALFGPAETETGGAPRPSRFAPPLENPALSPDGALELALAAEPGARLVSLSLPTEPLPAWRVQLAGDGGAPVTLEIDDASSEVRPVAVTAPGSADPVARLMRQVHDGHGMGLVWQVLVFLSGLLPALLWVTGIFMWLRRRRVRRPGAARPGAGRARDAAAPAARPAG